MKTPTLHSEDDNNNATSSINSANAITLAGFALTILSIILRKENAQGLITIVLIFLIALTDFFDGYVARKRKVKTWVGSNLDKLRDKFFSFSHFFFMLKSYFDLLESALFSASSIVALLFLMLSLDVILFLTALFSIVFALVSKMRGKEEKKIEANKWGKRKMVFQFITIFMWACFHDLGHKLSDPLPVLIICLLLVASIYLAGKSFGGYWEAYFPKNNASNAASEGN